MTTSRGYSGTPPPASGQYLPSWWRGDSESSLCIRYNKTAESNRIPKYTLIFIYEKKMQQRNRYQKLLLSFFATRPRGDQEERERGKEEIFGRSRGERERRLSPSPSSPPGQVNQSAVDVFPPLLRRGKVACPFLH